MYQDTESIKAFERQHARDRITELAHNISDEQEPDADLMTAHCISQAQSAWVSAVSIVFLIALSSFLFVGLS